MDFIHSSTTYAAAISNGICICGSCCSRSKSVRNGLRLFRGNWLHNTMICILIVLKVVLVDEEIHASLVGLITFFDILDSGEMAV